MLININKVVLKIRIIRLYLLIQNDIFESSRIVSKDQKNKRFLKLLADLFMASSIYDSSINNFD